MSEEMTREQAIQIVSEIRDIDGFPLDDKKAMNMSIAALSAEPMRWIPITYRKMTAEEKKDYSERTGYDEEDLDVMLDCPLPEDGETVLITDILGNVEVDTFVNDCDGCYFECNCDMDDVKAWMPLPKPYESEVANG